MYWNNSITQVSVWEEPEELKRYKSKLSELQSQSAYCSARLTPSSRHALLHAASHRQLALHRHHPVLACRHLARARGSRGE